MCFKLGCCVERVTTIEIHKTIDEIYDEDDEIHHDEKLRVKTTKHKVTEKVD